MTRRQKAALAAGITLLASTFALFLIPSYRDYHVFPEGMAIIVLTIFASYFSPSRGLIVTATVALGMVLSILSGVDGYFPQNIAYIYLTTCTFSAFIYAVVLFHRDRR